MIKKQTHASIRDVHMKERNLSFLLMVYRKDMSENKLDVNYNTFLRSLCKQVLQMAQLWWAHLEEFSSFIKWVPTRGWMNGVAWVCSRKDHTQIHSQHVQTQAMKINTSARNNKVYILWKYNRDTRNITMCVIYIHLDNMPAHSHYDMTAQIHLTRPTQHVRKLLAHKYKPDMPRHTYIQAVADSTNTHTYDIKW